MKLWMRIVVLVLALGMTACASQRGPAEAAIKSADTAWSAISAEASRYVPDRAKAIDAAFATAREAFNRGDYEAALKEATPLPTMIEEVKQATAEKKEEWMTAWRTLDSVVGFVLQAVGTKVGELAALRRLPAGVEKAAVEAAKTSLGAAEQMYADARDLFQKGDVEAALAKANEIKDQVAGVMTSLKLEMPIAEEAAKTLGGAALKTIEDMTKASGTM